MGRAPCCDKANVKKGPWSPEEDAVLRNYIEKYGTGGNWIALPQKAGLKRCGKSCRLRWLNYLRPNIKHGEFSDEEVRIISTLYATIGSRWSIIAAQLPGRTDNDIKNYWNTKLKKKLMGITTTTINNDKKSSSSSIPSPSFIMYHDQLHHHHHQIHDHQLTHNPTSPYQQCTITTYYNNSPSSSNTNSFSTMQNYQNNNTNNQNQVVKDNNTLLMLGEDNEINMVHPNYDANLYTIQDQNSSVLAAANYGLEEIKQMISTNVNNINVGDDSFNDFDEHKGGDENSKQLMYYY